MLRHSLIFHQRRSHGALVSHLVQDAQAVEQAVFYGITPLIRDSLVVLALLLLFAAFGQYLSPWDNESIDWASLPNLDEDGLPSLASQHYFGLDPIGRDLYQRRRPSPRLHQVAMSTGKPWRGS